MLFMVLIFWSTKVSVEFFSFSHILFYLNIFYTILYFALTENEKCERSSLIESDNERERSDAADGDATDIDDNVDVHINPEMADKIMSHDKSLLNNKARISLSLKQRMYKVISIKVNKKVTEV